MTPEASNVQVLVRHERFYSTSKHWKSLLIETSMWGRLRTWQGCLVLAKDYFCQTSADVIDGSHQLVAAVSVSAAAQHDLRVAVI